MDFDKHFSIAHWDQHPNDDDFYTAFAESSDDYKREIRDIYFGVEFRYEHLGRSQRYGETMGVAATEGQLNNLLRIQSEFGVECSMTVNSLNIPLELATDPVVSQKFINWIGEYYEKGVRSCTLSHTHFMRNGVLQKNFPNMNWKNTVNQQVKSVQEMYDFAALGYNTICFDRSLNRDTTTLKEIYREAKKVKIEVSLLASEGCLPSCPFKGEHDTWQEELQKSPRNYWETFDNTCTGWRARADAQMPRLGTDINMATEELFELFMENTDVLKFSGRMNAPSEITDAALCWTGTTHSSSRTGDEIQSVPQFEYADSVREIYEKKLAPYLIGRWTPGWTDRSSHTVIPCISPI